MQEFSIQQKFFELLKNFVPSNISIANELSTLLDCSVDGAYRRLRDQTKLTLDEAVKICHHFSVPLEALNEGVPNVVTLKINKLQGEFEDLKNYLTTMLNDLRVLAKVPGGKLYYVADEVPVFHYFFHRKLTAFKLFYWMKSILNHEGYQKKNFAMEVVPDEILDLCEEVYAAYAEVNTVEIWTEETINSLLRQVKFYWEAGFFDHENDVTDIADGIHALLDRLNQQCQVGKKQNLKGSYTASDFAFYISDLMLSTNTVQIVTPKMKIAYIGYNSINFMSCRNTMFNESISDWIENFIRKSTLLSGVSEKQRNQLFKLLIRRIGEITATGNTP